MKNTNVLLTFVVNWKICRDDRQTKCMQITVLSYFCRWVFFFPNNQWKIQACYYLLLLTGWQTKSIRKAVLLYFCRCVFFLIISEKYSEKYINSIEEALLSTHENDTEMRGKIHRTWIWHQKDLLLLIIYISCEEHTSWFTTL